MVTDEDNQKNAALHMAVENRSFDVTKILLEKGNRCRASLSIRQTSKYVYAKIIIVKILNGKRLFY